MKNILDEVLEHNLSGRLLASVKFVDDSDLKNKVALDIGCGYGWCELNFLNRGVTKVEKWPHSFEQPPEFFKWILC